LIENNVTLPAPENPGAMAIEKQEKTYADDKSISQTWQKEENL